MNVPLIHELRMSSRYEVEADRVHSTLDAAYDVPWYIDFLMYDIEKHLRQNFALKLDSVAQSLCAPAGAEAEVPLSEPAQKFKLQALRRPPAARPLHRLTSPLRRRVEQLPL